ALMLGAVCLPACSPAANTETSAESLTAPGALVRMDMSSTVGVLLDEIPAGPLREAAAAEALAKPASFWPDRAAHQTRLTYYRLVFRAGYYSSDHSSNKQHKGPLPLPPKEIWNIQLNGQARRDISPGHDLVIVDYTFSTHLVTDAASPGIVEA